jgi:hypothetical protein
MLRFAGCLSFENDFVEAFLPKYNLQLKNKAGLGVGRAFTTAASKQPEASSQQQQSPGLELK